MKSIQKIVLIGAGNVAEHLGQAFIDVGIKIIGIYSRTSSKSQKLALKFKCEVFDSIQNLPFADLYLICINDDQIKQVVKNIPSNQFTAYTSGTVELTQFISHKNIGVFYPLQTFSKDSNVTLFEVPFLIESNDTEFSQVLFELAYKISRNVLFATSEDRKKIHLAAVMINNFTNHLVYLATEFLEKNNLNSSILNPLLEETINKLKTTSPFDAQTGPARRGDSETIKAHLSLLDDNAKEIYKILSESITKHYFNK